MARRKRYNITDSDNYSYSEDDGLSQYSTSSNDFDEVELDDLKVEPRLAQAEPKSKNSVVTIGTKTFAAAFKQARVAGLDEFEWRGKRYTTKLKNEDDDVKSNTVKPKSNENVKTKTTPTKLVKRNKNNNMTNSTNNKQTVTKNRTRTVTTKNQSKTAIGLTTRNKPVQVQQSRNQVKQNVTPSKQQSTTQINKVQSQNLKPKSSITENKQSKPVKQSAKTYTRPNQGNNTMSNYINNVAYNAAHLTESDLAKQMEAGQKAYKRRIKARGNRSSDRVFKHLLKTHGNLKYGG